MKYTILFRLVKCNSFLAGKEKPRRCGAMAGSIHFLSNLHQLGLDGFRHKPHRVEVIQHGLGAHLER